LRTRNPRGKEKDRVTLKLRTAGKIAERITARLLDCKGGGILPGRLAIKRLFQWGINGGDYVFEKFDTKQQKKIRDLFTKAPGARKKFKVQMPEWWYSLLNDT